MFFFGVLRCCFFCNDQVRFLLEGSNGIDPRICLISIPKNLAVEPSVFYGGNKLG